MSLLLKALKQLEAVPRIRENSSSVVPIAEPTELVSPQILAESEPLLDDDLSQGIILRLEEILALSEVDAEYRQELLAGNFADEAMILPVAPVSPHVEDPPAQAEEPPATIPFASSLVEDFSISPHELLSANELPLANESAEPQSASESMPENEPESEAELDPPPIEIEATVSLAIREVCQVPELNSEPDVAILPIGIPQNDEKLFQQDQKALGERLSELRMQGLCEKIADQLSDTECPIVLFVPVVPSEETQGWAADLVRPLAAHYAVAPRILDLGPGYSSARINPLFHLDALRLPASPLLLTVDSVKSLSTADWLSACDAIYLVLDLALAPRRAAHRAIKQLQSQGAKLTGCILIEASVAR